MLRLSAAASLALVVLPAPALAQQPDLGPDAVAAVRIVERYAAALSRGDVPAALALFNDAAGYGGGWGAENLVSQLRRDAAAKRRLDVVWTYAEPDRAKPDTYAVTFGWRSNEDPYQRLGVPPLEGVDVATVQDGKITLITGRVDEDSRQRRAPAIEAALQTALRRAHAQATETARATAVAGSGTLHRLPDTQGRGNRIPTAALALASVCLLATIVLAARPRTDGSTWRQAGSDSQWDAL